MLFDGAVRNTMIDVVICSSLDPEHFSKSLETEVGHRELFVQTQETGKASLKRTFVLYRSFPRQMRKTQIVVGFLFLLFVHGLFMLVETRLADFF